ncbi:MAG: RNA recognition motif domain-containing protein [Vicinamibacteria bacterium]|jgi:RNA recognition motif-containing protein
MNIYVGNLPFSTTEAELREVFERFGRVDSASIIVDRHTNQSRGFGFVEMANAEEAKAAIEALNGTDMSGRTLRVNEARARTERKGGRF